MNFLQNVLVSMRLHKWAEQITGIPEKNIRRLALFFGQAKAPAILLGSGFSRYGNGGMTSRLITVLSAFTGAWGKPGGGICAAEHNGGPFVDAKRVTRPDFRKVSGPGVNINCLGSALTAEGEDAVKALVKKYETMAYATDFWWNGEYSTHTKDPSSFVRM